MDRMKPPPANLVLALAATILGVAGSSGCKGSSPSGGDGGRGIPAVDLPGSQIPPMTPCELDLDFGDVPLGAVDSVVFQIENDGDGVLDLSTINPTLDPEFALDAGTLQSIQPGRSDYVTVTFQPTRVGVVTSAFAIQTDGINPRCSAQTGSSTGNIITVALTGNGI